MGEKIKAGKGTHAKRTTPFLWEIVKQGDMRVPGRIYGDRETVDTLVADVRKGKDWNALDQIANVACLPGIQVASLAMADVHPGYGFPIGGVGAFDLKSGVISVAGVGFDINCGVRTLRTPLVEADIQAEEETRSPILSTTQCPRAWVPPAHPTSTKEIDAVLRKGARFSGELRYGLPEDLEYIEDGGCLREPIPTPFRRKPSSGSSSRSERWGQATTTVRCRS